MIRAECIGSATCARRLSIDSSAVGMTGREFELRTELASIQKLFRSEQKQVNKLKRKCVQEKKKQRGRATAGKDRSRLGMTPEKKTATEKSEVEWPTAAITISKTPSASTSPTCTVESNIKSEVDEPVEETAKTPTANHQKTMARHRNQRSTSPSHQMNGEFVFEFLIYRDVHVLQ